MKTYRGQTKVIFEHLNTVGSITSMEAFQKYGATRLSAIIFNLRKDGHNIITADMETVTRYGQTCRYAKYTLIK